MSDPGALDEAVERIAARHGKQHVGLVVGAVTSSGARSVVPVGRVRAPDGPAPRTDTLFVAQLPEQVAHAAEVVQQALHNRSARRAASASASVASCSARPAGRG